MASAETGYGEPVPRSQLPGIVWPAMLDGPGAQALALQFQLAQSQWWSPERLRAQQFRQLALLVRHAGETVPYYRGRLPAGLLGADGAIRADAWAKLPVLGRAAVQQAGDALNSGFVPRGHGSVSTAKTSGSTGRPVEVASTALMGILWNAFTLRDHLWHRRDLSAKLAVIRHLHGHDQEFPDGTSRRGWGPATDLAYETGVSAAISIHTDVAKLADWLVREDPAYLIAYPSNLLALSEQFLDRGLRLPQLREIRTVSEMLTREVRAACRRVWGVPVTDMYSIQECGYLALQCPAHEHYHVQSEGVLLEILDEDGRACAPGQTGRVVVTPLHNYATVLLRYEVGDYAESGEPCPCGRGLPVINRILGRYRNMAILPGRRTVWPLIGHPAMRAIAPLAQIQVAQRSLEEMELRYAAERALTADEERGLSEMLARNLGHPFRITFRRMASIPRSASGKFEDFICEVARGA
jgi:phenylacetate-CoA ligase